jgi:hypothetical protein
MRPIATAVAVILAAGLVGFSLAAASTGRTEPAPIRGVPLEGKSGLQLLVGGAPPFVLDVDRGSMAAIRSTPDMRSGIVVAQDLGGTGAVISTGGFNSTIDVLRQPKARPLRLGTARSVTPSADGRSLWLKSAVTGSGCRLRHVGLDGRQTGEARPLACSMTIEPGGSLGLIGGRTKVFDPLSGKTILTTRCGVLAAAGKRLVQAGPEKNFTLLDTGSGAERVFGWPSGLYGLDAPRVDRQGRFVALSFAEPALSGGGQAMDVWILDTQTGELAQVPGMPAVVDLKFTSMEWTRDGRLVFLVQWNGQSLVAVWRPGDTKLQVKRMRLPKRSGGSDTFAILP